MENETKERHRTVSNLVSFVLLFFPLYLAFGAASPFLPAFFASRGLSSEQIGVLVSLGIMVRLASNLIGGRIADRLHARHQVLTICLLGAALLAFSLIPAYGFLLLLIISLMHAAMLAPTTTLADALALRTASPDCNSSARFEYGWVRGTGSAAFVIGSLVSGQAVNTLGPAAALAGQALFLAGAAGAATFVAEPRERQEPLALRPRAATPGLWILLRNRPFTAWYWSPRSLWAATPCTTPSR
jgi:PPP family 3-phenylpropionic acid transporter